MKLSREYLNALKPPLSSSWKLGCMLRHPTKCKWMRAGSSHSSTLQRSQVTPVHIIPHLGWHGLYMLVLCPSSFICPEWPLAAMSFLFCFQTLISFYQFIMFEDFRVKAGWEIHLSVDTWKSIINFGWQLCWNNWAPVSALGSVEFTILLLLLFWCCKIQWRGLERLLFVCS